MSEKPIKPKSTCNKLKNVFLWYDCNNTVGGWTPTFHSDNIISRLCWGCLLILGNILTYQSIVKSFERYFEYNIVTTVESQFQKNGLVLPAIAICNSNRVHCRNLYNVINDTKQVTKDESNGFF